jgi:hypothetical protein
VRIQLAEDMKHLLLVTLVLVSCEGFETLPDIIPPAECRIEGSYLVELLPMTKECGEPHVTSAESGGHDLRDCMGVQYMPAFDSPVSIVCRAGDPSEECFAAVLIGDCPYSIIMHLDTVQ